jgi:hypothetical protein
MRAAHAVHAGGAVAAAFAAFVAGVAPARAEFVRTGQSDPYSGIHRETWRDSAINARIHLVRVDLTSAEIVLVATKESERGRKTTRFAADRSAAIAINGGPFAVSGYVPRGLAMGDTVTWTGTADDAITSVLHFRRVGEQTRLEIVPPEEIVVPGALPPGTQGILSGRPLLVRAGVAIPPPDCNDPVAIPCTRAPRTAVAVSADGNTMWIAVADGWQAISVGVTAQELGAFLQARGAHMAVNLDGGGSSTLFVGAAGGIVNAPSDGVERVVANHLAVLHNALPPGEVVGLICENTFSPCSKPIVGAVVTLDDGRMTTSSDGAGGTQQVGRYAFQNVTPRLACATARKAGYRTNSRCNYVSSGEVQFNSIALMPGVDPPDAGVPDAPVVPGDGAALGDGGFGGDGGMTPPEGAGCCDARRDRPPIWLAVLVAALAFRSVRRRGTKA